MTTILKEYLEKGKSEVTILECACREEAERFMAQVADLPNVTNIKISEISPALGVHGGPGLMGFAVKLVE